MEKDFLLTYSVTNKCAASDGLIKEKADRVRRDIAALTCWKKLRNVETTFFGAMNITAGSDCGKKTQAQENIQNVFIPILQKYGVTDLDVTIHCALMIEGSRGVEEFVVKNV